MMRLHLFTINGTFDNRIADSMMKLPPCLFT